MNTTTGHLIRAATAAGWSYGGRLVGLAWTALLISRLGIGDYGHYALAVAIAAVINAAADNAYFVRSLRVDEDHFVQERSARTLFGLAMLAVGCAVFIEWFVAGFAVTMAAGELLFNTRKSRDMRDGRPDRTMRLDTVRQLTSIGLAGGYILTAQSPALHLAGILYLLPYLLIGAVCVPYVTTVRHGFPGTARGAALLSAEALAAAVYSQAPLIAVGLVAGSEVAGYYSVAQVTALAIAMFGQHFANTYVAGLRTATGDVRSAPDPRAIVRMAVATGAAMAVLGAGIALWGGAGPVGAAMLILSVFVFARSVNFVFTVILFLQHRDRLRVRATVTLALGQWPVLVVTAHLCGVYGTAVTGTLCELVLLLVYRRAIYAGGPGCSPVAHTGGTGTTSAPARTRVINHPALESTVPIPVVPALPTTAALQHSGPMATFPATRYRRRNPGCHNGSPVQFRPVPSRETTPV